MISLAEQHKRMHYVDTCVGKRMVLKHFKTLNLILVHIFELESIMIFLTRKLISTFLWILIIIEFLNISYYLFVTRKVLELEWKWNFNWLWEQGLEHELERINPDEVSWLETGREEALFPFAEKNVIEKFKGAHF